MRRVFFFFVVFGFCMVSSAFAQFQIEKLSTKTVCNRRCNIRILEVEKYETELLKLKEKNKGARSNETDPEKLKILEVAEKKELEKFHQKCEAICEGICRNNPD